MTGRDETVPMSPEDRMVFRKKMRTALAITGSFVALFFSVGFFILWNVDQIAIQIFGVVFVSIPFTVIVYIVYVRYRDLKLGTKRIIAGVLENKFESSSTPNSDTSSMDYFLTIQKHNIKVDYQDYKMFKVGQEVEIQITSGSGMVLSVKHINGGEHIGHDAERPAPERIAPVLMEPLTSQDISYLTVLRNKRILSTLLLAAGAAAAVYYIVFPAAVIVLTLVMHLEVPSFIGYIRMCTYAGMAAAAWGAYYLRMGRFTRDISRSRKNVMHVMIDDKVSSNVIITRRGWRVTTSKGDFRYIVIGGHYYEVGLDDYDAFIAGEEAAIHRSQVTGTVLALVSNNGKGYHHYGK